MINKNWLHLDPHSPEYRNGVLALIDYAYEHATVDENGNLKCPCVNCKNFKFQTRAKFFEHLVCDGMLGVYTTTTWLHHGERKESTSTPETRVPTTEERTAGSREDDMLGMFRDLYPGVNADIVGGEEVLGEEVLSQSPDEGVTTQFHKLLEESKKELYPGSEKTMLSFFIRFWQIKCLNGLSNNAFMKMLNLFRENLPEGCNLPEIFTQCKKLISDLGLLTVGLVQLGE